MAFDLIVAGPPCPPFSTFGKRVRVEGRESSADGPHLQLHHRSSSAGEHEAPHVGSRERDGHGRHTLWQHLVSDGGVWVGGSCSLSCKHSGLLNQVSRLSRHSELFLRTCASSTFLFLLSRARALFNGATLHSSLTGNSGHTFFVADLVYEELVTYMKKEPGKSWIIYVEYMDAIRCRLPVTRPRTGGHNTSLHLVFGRASSHSKS